MKVSNFQIFFINSIHQIYNSKSALYVCVYIYMHICICIFICICTHTRKHTRTKLHEKRISTKGIKVKKPQILVHFEKKFLPCKITNHSLPFFLLH